jgi:hypothetical protein
MPDERAVVISLRAKYAAADRKYLVPLECLEDLVLDLRRLNTEVPGRNREAANKQADVADKAAAEYLGTTVTGVP